MRNLSQASLDKIAQRTGIEPISIARVWWTDNGYIDYADRSIGPVQGKLLTLSDLENVINVQGNSSSTSVNLTLDDSDGSLKTIFDNTDIHRRRVQILQWFSDIPLNEAFVIFDGEIASPVTWNEGSRTLAFDVLSKLQDREVGFSVEEGEFNWAPAGIVGQAWPLVFGTVVGIPALQVTGIPTGLTGNPSILKEQQDAQKQIDEYNLRIQQCLDYANYCFLISVECYAIAQNFYNDMVADRVNGGTTDWTSEIQSWRSQGQNYLDQGNQYLAQKQNLQQELENFQNEEVAKKALFKAQIKAISADQFPQGEIMSVIIGGYTYQGYFDSGNFNITQQPTPFDESFTPAGLTTITDEPILKRYATQLPPARFVFNQGGSSILAGDAYELTFIAAYGHVQVIGVQAKRNGLLIGVPNHYWSVEHVTNGNYRYTIIKLPKPLSSRMTINSNGESVSEGWEDNLFISMIGEVPGVPTTILEWLITNYTPYEIDTDSFAAVAPYINRYPMNFALQDRPNILQLLQELAFQARCALWFSNGKFFIKFLPAVGTIVETITETDVDLNSIEVSYTSTEDLVTKFTAEWYLDHTVAKPNKIIYRNQIARYGTIEETYNFFAYNIQACVQKMAEFWLIRKSNTFKRISFRTFLTKLKIETWDTITLDFNTPIVANGPVPAIVESAKFDTSNWKFVITAWVPVLAGTMTQFDYAFPADLPVEFIYPISNNNTPTLLPPTQPLADVQPFHSSVVFPDGRHKPIGDQHDDTNGSDFQVELSLDQREIESGDAPVFSPGTYNQFQITPPTATDQVSGLEPDQLLFGIVGNKLQDNKYNVDITNLATGETQTVSATQFRLNGDDVVPSGTPTVVVRKTIRVPGSGDVGAFSQVPQVKRIYYMQVPVWVKPQSETSDFGGGGDFNSPPPPPETGQNFGSSGDPGSGASGEE